VSKKPLLSVVELNLPHAFQTKFDGKITTTTTTTTTKRKALPARLPTDGRDVRRSPPRRTRPPVATQVTTVWQCEAGRSECRTQRVAVTDPGEWFQRMIRSRKAHRSGESPSGACMSTRNEIRLQDHKRSEAPRFVDGHHNYTDFPKFEKMKKKKKENSKRK
jgi:hypothetical protein